VRVAANPDRYCAHDTSAAALSDRRRRAIHRISEKTPGIDGIGFLAPVAVDQKQRPDQIAHVEPVLAHETARPSSAVAARRWISVRRLPLTLRLSRGP